jgi:hypothetical protein
LPAMPIKNCKKLYFFLWLFWVVWLKSGLFEVKDN